MNFDEIYQEYSPQIYRLCMAYVNDHDWAKDLVQETFIAVWNNLGKFRKESAIATWIYRIATNVCLRQIGNQKRDQKRISELPRFESSSINEEKENTQLMFLRKCISELKEIERLIISMVLEEISYDEIAEVIGISEGNLRVKIHRIKEKLNKKFKKNGRV